MAKQRYIDTRFWDDTYTCDLDPIEKLLFLYFLTNPLSNICGAYEISLKRIAFDTGIDKDMVLKILARFEKSERIIYKDGWVCILNFIKNQSNAPKIQQGIENAVKCCPDWVKHTLSIRYQRLSHLNLNLNNNLNNNSNNNNNVETTGFVFETESQSLKDEIVQGIKERTKLNVLNQEHTWIELAEFAFANGKDAEFVLLLYDTLDAQLKHPKHWRKGRIKASTVKDNFSNLKNLKTELKNAQEKQNGVNQKYPTKRTDADVIDQSAEFYENFPN